MSPGHTILMAEGEWGIELVNLTCWSAYLDSLYVDYDANFTLAQKQSFFCSK